ncbi:MAG: hypothetical protein GY791_15925 [Alphaproteobacteria bacterium]|nr:hypothetical protein [Alphaproteobacteria bacterium]
MKSLKACKLEVIEPRAAKFHGRIARMLDGRVLIEFKSAEDAVAFSIDMQSTMRVRNRPLREDRQLQYRIGIDHGDISDAGGTVQGEPVTTAENLTELADLGGIAISGRVRDDIAENSDLNLSSLTGPRTNAEPAPTDGYGIALDDKAAAFATASQRVSTPASEVTPKTGISTARRSLSTWVAAAGIVIVLLLAGGLVWWAPWTPTEGRGPGATAELPLPDQPSIAVMPFESLTPGEHTAMLAHSMTAALITALGQVPTLFVINRSATHAYQGERTDPRETSKALGVRYILDGTLQESNGRVRATVELIDGTTGNYVWTQRYDRALDDIFAIQDEIALKVLVSLQVQLTEGDQAVVRGTGTTNVDAYLLLLQAEGTYRRFTRGAMVETRRLVRQILKLDPGYRQALLLEAQTHIIDAQWGLSGSKEASLEMAADILRQAAAMDGVMTDAEKAELLMVEAYIYQIRGDFDVAERTGNRAAALGPNNANLLAINALIQFYDRNYDESIGLLQKAMHLSPVYPSWYSLYMARNYAFKGEAKLAVEWSQDGIERAENDTLRSSNTVTIAFAYQDAGRTADAQRAAQQILDIRPDFAIRSYTRGMPFRSKEDLDRYTDALRAAGLPE